MGELVVKGPSIMMGYYQNEEATAEVLKDGWFYTGDLAKIDEDGYIFICGRKKSVIVLKNGKNIFPEEMEALVNKIEGVKESFIYGKKMSDDENDIKINVKIVIDRAIVEDSYKVNTDKEIKAAISEKIFSACSPLIKRKSLERLERSGSFPSLILWALTTISDSKACRKIFFNCMAFMQPEERISLKTFPAPTEGS